MDDAKREWYRKGLRPRIEALDLALRGLAQQQEEALAGLRRLAQSLRVSSRAYGFEGIALAAEALEAAPEADAAAGGAALAAALRTELAGQPPPPASVLIVGGEPAAVAAIQASLKSRGKTALLAAGAEEARRILTAREIVFLVVDLFLPDSDGRAFIASLRSRPLTAAIPVAVITARVGSDHAEQNLVLDADAVFEKPVDAERVADYVAQRMKRAHEIQRAARRDLLTGLLNRAAFCEHKDILHQAPVGAREPAALALLKIDRLQAVLDEHGTGFRDQVVRHVAALLSVSFRAMDIIARWEVAEFAVLFPGEDQFGGMRAVEKIMAALRRAKLRTPAGTMIPVTLSAGLTVVNETTICDEAMERAAHFLYLAESGGGDRLVSSDTESERRTDQILIVSGDRSMADIIKNLISRNRLNVEVTLAQPAEVRERVAARRFHLLLLDDATPGGGVELLRALRAGAGPNRLPVIMLVSAEAGMVAALEAGANDYMRKPIQPLALLASIRRVLSRGLLGAGAATTTLVANDDLGELVIVGTALHKAGGFKVLMERHGQAALHRLLDVRPRIVLWDWDLDTLNGAALIKTLDQSLGYEKTAVLFLADAAAEPEIRRLASRRVRGVIRRPVDALNLAATVRGLLNLLAPEISTPSGDEPQWQLEIQRLFQGPVAAA